LSAFTRVLFERNPDFFEELFAIIFEELFQTLLFIAFEVLE
jgi:hypothetical protein